MPGVGHRGAPEPRHQLLRHQPNGEYDFGGGTVYSPVFIPSQSGYNVNPGDPLPNTLASLLVGYPYSYTVAVAHPIFRPARISVLPPSTQRRQRLLPGHLEDQRPRTLDYGLRYEVYPYHERATGLRVSST